MPYLLVLEQDPKVAKEIEKIAKPLGYVVSVVNEIKQVLLILQQRNVTALVADLAVYETAKTQIQQTTSQFLPVIALGRQASTTLKKRAQALDVTALIDTATLASQLAPILSSLIERFYEDKYQLGPNRNGHELTHFIGRSAAMQQLYFEIERVAKTNVPVLIIGESGTGKELVALALHEYSARAAENFLPLNCGAISSQLIESELFGHEKGSFTGADKARQGFFELAQKGTLFLDEITEMPPEMQVRLLRVLETGQYMRVGGTKLLTTEARIIAATNRDPMQAVEQEKLREDLFYRLSVFPIHVPPLRDRDEDIVLLAHHFLQQMNQEQGTEKYFTPEAEELLRQHLWPGNVRELRNAVWRSYILAEHSQVNLMIEHRHKSFT